jgi:putative two-component system response regulator
MNNPNEISILVVDDDALVRECTSSQLQEEGYSVISAENARDALHKLQSEKFNAVLSDIRMPEISGIELLKEIRRIAPDMPVILITGYAELNVATEAMRNGAFDLILKPFDLEYLIVTVKRAVEHYRLTQMEKNYKRELKETVKKRTSELETALNKIKSSNREMIQRLLIASEYRDDDTGNHIKRIGLYSVVLARALEMPVDFIEDIAITSSMHDVGKIGIPDSILQKQGPLLPSEFETMKTHSLIGAQILSDPENPMLKMAQTIALGHHERYDGTGYPRALKGDDIAMECRIVMICDQYDAMRSKRPYKPPFDHEKTFKIITEGDKRTEPAQFDPRILDAFVKVNEKFNEIF